MPTPVKRINTQRKLCALLDHWEKEISEVQKRRNLLINCGLDKEADVLYAKLQQAQNEREKVAQAIIEQRIDLCKRLLRVIVACNLAYAYCGDFRHAVNEADGGHDGAHHFAQTIQELENKAKEVVFMLDEAGEYGASSYSYADFETALEDRIEPMLQAEIDKATEEYTKSKDFKKYYL